MYDGLSGTPNYAWCDKRRVQQVTDSPGLNLDEINPDEMISCDLYEGVVRLEADAAIVATAE